MGGLFDEIERKNREARLPLAVRMRPRTLEEFLGQKHFLSEGKLLRRMILADRVGSVILYGPPGCGKTSLAHLIARHTKARFVERNAAECGVKEVRGVLDDAADILNTSGERTVLFLDEIHHFNRSQQDILLPHVENGALTLIGATTMNPFFALNAPLLSRSQLFSFQPLSKEDLVDLLRRAAADSDRGFGKLKVELSEEAIDHWATICDGDARRVLTALEIAVRSFPVGTPIHIDRTVAEESIQTKAIVHDGTGDEHYDVVSAFIKSMRGSDPDAAIYWLARLLEVGEDPRFIARRLVICASEDVGLADSRAFLIASDAMRAVETIGMPECQLNLSHATLYLALAPKSNSATTAIGNAQKEIRSGRTLSVPPHLKDSHYSGASQLGAGEGYQYAHNYPDGWVEQAYLPEPLKLYHPTSHGDERRLSEALAHLRSRKSPKSDSN